LIKDNSNNTLIEKIRNVNHSDDHVDIISSSQKNEDQETGQFILCRCGDVFISFPIEDVKELVALEELDISLFPTLVLPNLGIVRRKGDLIPLASLPAIVCDNITYVSRASARAVICHISEDDKLQLFGLLVDEVLAVAVVELDALTLLSKKAAGSEAGRDDMFLKILEYEDNEYRIIDTRSLYKKLSATIHRRKAI